MKHRTEPLYTIESFINNFIGGWGVLKELEEQEGGEVYMKWDGLNLFVSPDRAFTAGLDTDIIKCYRISPGVFDIGLNSRNYWYMTFNFSDGGFVKNRVYRVSDYMI